MKRKILKYLIFSYTIFCFLLSANHAFACDVTFDHRDINVLYFNVEASSNDTCYFVFTNQLIASQAIPRIVLEDSGLKYEKYIDKDAAGYIVKLKSPGRYRFSYIVDLTEAAGGAPYELRKIFNVNVSQ